MWSTPGGDRLINAGDDSLCAVLDAVPSMNFPHETSGDTIVALSTPRGYSGIGVVRMSGPEALSILKSIFQSVDGRNRFPDRRAVYGRVLDPERNEVLDDGIALFMQGPGTYTGEDVVELSLHGSPLVLDLVVQSIVRQGARPATRGEFTRRAFMSGRMDLVQAEAVIDLIEATSPASVKDARARLDRQVSARVLEISDALRDLLAELEAHLDFDEDDEEPIPDPIPALQTILEKMRALKENAEVGRIRREGLRAVIVGKPNVGKSTLFNALLRRDRTIVTPYPGTTRDTVDEYLLLGEVSILLCDTAGIRREPDPIEKEGISRTLDRINEDDLLITVLDASGPLEAEDNEVLAACAGTEAVLVLNKIDLGQAIRLDHPELQPFLGPRVCLSAKTGAGMDALTHSLRVFGEQKAVLPTSRQEGSLSHRAVLLLEAAAMPIEAVLDTYKRDGPVPPVIVALETRSALRSLGEITGQGVDEGVLDRIFERFCVGK